MSDYAALADEVSAVEGRVADALFDAVRAQLRGDPRSADQERQLARVRRSLVKAEALLRALSEVADQQSD
ncbi:MAG: hypothetical protein ACP5OV_04835 [Acidimicrobiales bacterium]